MKENKFMMGEEEESNNKSTTATAIPPFSPPPSNTTTSHSKKPVRHHVKRRSSGRVHVAKLAPMARANNASHTDSETDLLDDTNDANRPVMRRSQSQRSLHRMSFDRKGFATITTIASPVTTRRKLTASEKPVVSDMMVSTPPDEPPLAPAAAIKKYSHIETSSSSTHSTTSNPAALSSRVVAAPIEQTFNAVANNLAIPKTSTVPLKAAAKAADIQPAVTAAARKQLLKSQFIASSYDEPSSITPSTSPKRHESPLHMTSTTRNAASNLSRTQQKLMLQRQQAQVQDETSPIHPRNMQKINKELELLSREYRCMKRYQDPMRASLSRCLKKLDLQQGSNPALNRLQLGANKHSMSTFVVPTIHPPYIPHLEQRQIAHRHHHLKAVAAMRKQQLQEELNHHHESHDIGFPWNATAAFLDRMFSSSNHH